MTRRRDPSKPKRRYWSAAELKRLAKLYPDRPTEAIAKQLGRTVESTYNAAHKLGLTKSAEFRKNPLAGGFQKGSQIGAQFRFVKGQVPPNKGLRRPGYSIGRGRMEQTTFKKGQTPRNWQPVGSIRTNSEGYLEVKVREGMWNAREGQAWQLLNREVWKRERGPIPPGHLVVFKDGDRMNCAIENLELISTADNARRNSMWATMPRELAEVMQLNGALKRKLRSIDGKKQDQRPAGSPVRDARSAQRP
jgi:hypothetical protein